MLRRTISKMLKTSWKPLKQGCSKSKSRENCNFAAFKKAKIVYVSYIILDPFPNSRAKDGKRKKMSGKDKGMKEAPESRGKVRYDLFICGRMWWVITYLLPVTPSHAFSRNGLNKLHNVPLIISLPLFLPLVFREGSSHCWMRKKHFHSLLSWPGR